MRIKFKTEIEYSDKVSLDLGWFKKLADYIYRNLFSLDRNYLYIQRQRQRLQRLIDYPHFYYDGYIRFFTEKREVVFPFDNENSKNVVNFMKDELTHIVLSKYFFEENEPLISNENKPLILNIKLKVDLIEKV